MQDSENTTSSTSNYSFIQISLVVIALALGGASLFLAINSAKKAASVQEELTEKIDRFASASLEVKKLSDRVDSLALQLDTIKSGNNTKMDKFMREVESAISKIVSGIKTNAEAIEANKKAIEELAKRQVAVAPAPKPEAAQPATSETPATTPQEQGAEGETVHVVKAGDSFSKIAAQYKISVERIQQANPGVESNRLQIGQKLKIVK